MTDKSEFAARPAAEGTVVAVTVGNEERELRAVKVKGGWAIQPADAAEAAALAAFNDEALGLGAAPAEEEAPAADEAAPGGEEDQP